MLQLLRQPILVGCVFGLIPASIYFLHLNSNAAREGFGLGVILVCCLYNTLLLIPDCMSASALSRCPP